MLDAIVIGSGIAGLASAYFLEQRECQYLQICDTRNPLANTSSKSYGHCRIVPNPAQLYERSKALFGLPEIEKVFYEQSNEVKEFFKQLGIPFRTLAFGIIPTSKQRGGSHILSSLHARVKPIMIETQALSVHEEKDHVQLTTTRGDFVAKHVILAIGGYAQYTHKSDAIAYTSAVLFENLEKHIIHKDSIFYHPFGIKGGKDILNGSQASKGQFITEDLQPYFPPELELAIQRNEYHELFHEILSHMQKAPCFFDDGNQLQRVTPVAHYTSGGFRTDSNCKLIDSERIFATGECQADGQKNGGRLPGMPFTKSIVSGKIIADAICSKK